MELVSPINPNGYQVCFWASTGSSMYRQTAHDYNEFLPVFEIYSEEEMKMETDGQISVTTRYMMPEAWAELYFEYGRNDAL